MTQHCGFIAIIGAPNAGKSTLVNALVGGKISIVTPKVQTTRVRVRGVCNSDDTQLILVDTPGIFEGKRDFEKHIVKEAWAGVGDADVILLVADASLRIDSETRAIIAGLKTGKPVCLALNKIDLLKRSELLEIAQQFSELYPFQEVFMIAAAKKDGVERIKKTLAAKLPEAPWLYPEEQMGDIALRDLAAEITREKLFMLLNQELPYSIHVETETWEESKTSIKIAQVIFVERDGQKTIVIGKGGSMLKKIGTAARLEMQYQFDQKVHLNLFVKVDDQWKNRQIKA